MEEIKEQIKHVLLAHRTQFKNENRVIHKVFDILEKEMSEDFKEDIYTTEKIECSLTGVTGIKHCKNGKLHRSGGEPAVIYSNGDKHWYENGLCHRIDGPARDFHGGWKYYYIHGTPIKTDKS